jgi:hypothetical protein
VGTCDAASISVPHLVAVAIPPPTAAFVAAKFLGLGFAQMAEIFTAIGALIFVLFVLLILKGTAR